MMKRSFSRRGLGFALTISAAGVVAAATATAALASAPASAHSSVRAPSCSVSKSAAASRRGHIWGIVHAQGTGCAATNVTNLSEPALGTPPLLFNGGPVMSTAQTGPAVLTPIYWQPSDHPMDNSYQNIISTYMNGVALSSHRTDNVYSIDTEYPGSNGPILPGLLAGAPIVDNGPLPDSGCTLTTADMSGVYSDGSGYNACLDDNQIQAEVNRVIAAQGLPADLAHIYVIYLPKAVESCFNPGSTLTSANACTINHEPSAAFCAYHSQANVGGAIYANMPFPIYNSTTIRFTCGSNHRGGTPVVEAPNGNPDADTIISTTSHEINESITDPEGSAWFDSSGNEIGDECNGVFGPTRGGPGALYNQIIGNHHYLTQEEFSNRDFGITGLGCKAGEVGLITG